MERSVVLQSRSIYLRTKLLRSLLPRNDGLCFILRDITKIVSILFGTPRFNY